MDVNLRDGLLLAVSTLPLSIAVATVGLDSGLSPVAVLLSSALMFSAAAQLLVYKGVTGTMPGIVALAGVIGIALRIVVYALDIHKTFADRSVARRAFYLLPLTDISYLEYLRHGDNSADGLRRYLTISRCLWSSWQIGALIAVFSPLPDLPFPREGVSVLIFLCLAIAVGRRLRPETSLVKKKE